MSKLSFEDNISCEQEIFARLERRYRFQFPRPSRGKSVAQHDIEPQNLKYLCNELALSKFHSNQAGYDRDEQ